MHVAREGPLLDRSLIILTMKKIIGATFQQERDLYRTKDTEFIDCRFEGEEDGESPLKECSDCILRNCTFKLRYPCWFARNSHYYDTVFEETSRAPYWYCKDSTLKRVKVHGVKFMRECHNITSKDCLFQSEEFGWRCSDMEYIACQIESQYVLFENKRFKLENCRQKGKYSFQYCEDFEIKDCILDTKDAFWHSKRGTIVNSVVKGEYLAWYSEDLTFINCTIEGAQPFVTCKGLRLINCKMINTDLAFEESEIEVESTTPIMSVKNPKSGIIKAPSIGEIILDENAYHPGAKIVTLD